MCPQQGAAFELEHDCAILQRAIKTIYSRWGWIWRSSPLEVSHRCDHGHPCCCSHCPGFGSEEACAMGIEGTLAMLSLPHMITVHCWNLNQ